MSDSDHTVLRKPVVLPPGEGRSFPMGRIGAVFKADGAETGSRYSVSEWWLEPHTQGPGAHAHPEDGNVGDDGGPPGLDLDGRAQPAVLLDEKIDLGPVVRPPGVGSWTRGSSGPRR